MMQRSRRAIWAGVNAAFSKLLIQVATAPPFSPAMDANAESGEPPLSHPASTAVANAASATSESEARTESGSFMALQKTQPHKLQPQARPRRGREIRCAARTKFLARAS